MPSFHTTESKAIPRNLQDGSNLGHSVTVAFPTQPECHAAATLKEQMTQNSTFKGGRGPDDPVWEP